jgi:hypothetical protein
MAADDDLAGPPPLSMRDSTFRGDRSARPWNFRLGLFLRALAVVELAKGLFYWALLIGAGGAAEPLPHAKAEWLVATVFFAVADPVAAVGLWVGTAWGVAIWLIAAAAQLVVIGIAGPAAAGWLTIASLIGAMTAYVALSAKARREHR